VVLNRRSHLALVLGLSAIFLVRGRAQQPTFRAGTTLVTFDVTVLNRDGHPVPGLTPDDFDIRLNNKPQPVRAVAFLEASTPSPAAEPAKPAGDVARAPVRASNTTPEPESRVFVVLVDDLSIRPGDAKNIFVAAEKFLDKLSPTDVVGFATSSGHTPPINPTLDRAPIANAVKHAVGELIDPRTVLVTAPFVGVREALLIDEGSKGELMNVISRDCAIPPTQNMEQVIATNDCASDVDRTARRTASLARRQTMDQLNAYVAAIQAMRSVGGIKHLIIFTGGLGLGLNNIDLVPVAKAAASAGVQLSVLNNEPDEVDMSMQVPPGPLRDDNLALLQGAQTMTDMSGGQFYRVIGQADRYFDQVLVSASAIYRIGVELPPNTAPDAELTVTAAVKRGGLTVLASRYAVAPGAPTTGSAPDRLQELVTTGRREAAVPVDMGAVIRRVPHSTQLEVDVNVSVPASVPGPLQGMFALVDSSGHVQAGKWTATAADDGPYRVTVPIRADRGRYVLRVAAADATGAVGSAESPVEADLNVMGSFTSSDLLTWWADAGGQRKLLTLEAVPSGVTTLHASIELYPTTPEAAPTVLFRIAPLGGDQTSSSASDSHEVTSVQDGDMFKAETSIGIGSLPAGAYALHATVTVGGRTIGQLATTFRK
jgi:VWFA-related protein